VRPGARHDWQGPPWATRGRHPRLFLPALLTLVQVVGTAVAAGRQPLARPLDAVGYALLVAGPVAYGLLRRARLLTLAGTLVPTVGYALAGYPRGPYFVAAVVALFAAVRTGARVGAWVECAVAYAAYVGLGALVPSVGGIVLTRPTLGGAVGVATWTVVALALAEAARGRSERFAEMRRAGAEAARARAEQSRRQASEERLRIARELHDVLGHHLSLINMRAGVALHLLDTQPPERAPEQARDAFDAIKQASAEALREVRGVLAALRPADESAPRSPTPGLADLDALVEQARAAGLPVTLRLDGLPAVLPAEVDRAAYRIVQEALTNVRRHAGPNATATVCIGWSPQALTVRVDDDGAGPAMVAPAEPGNGIPGMRERAAALGGELSAGGRGEGGFRVRATLPLAGVAS
jgi:signal transduction histidine kinase